MEHAPGAERMLDRSNHSSVKPVRDMRDTRRCEHSAKKYVALTQEGREGGHIEHLCKVSSLALGMG